MATKYEKLKEISSKTKDLEWGKDHEVFFNHYALGSPLGRSFYKSLSNKVLLNVLRDRAKELGYSPSQKEVFWIWREYLKERFKRWPYALEAAGLPKSSGRGGVSLKRASEMEAQKMRLVASIREKAIELGRLPHTKDLSDEMLALFKASFSWHEIIQAANLDQSFFQKNALFKIEDIEPQYQKLLDDLMAQSKVLGRPPMRSEVDPDLKEQVVSRCGSWRNALYQIDLEPVRRIKPFSSLQNSHKTSGNKRQHRNTLYDCYYRVLDLDEQSRVDLLSIHKIQFKLGRPPEKDEIPKEMRMRLKEKCGSWANTLHQIKYITDK